MKALPPSLRKRKRYIVFDVDSEDDFLKKELSNAIWREALALFGEAGASDLGMALVEFNGSQGILRCNHNQVERVRAVLASLRSVKRIRAVLYIASVGGTMRTAIEKFKRKKGIGKVINNIPSRVELKYVSGKVKRIRDEEIDIIPDKNEIIERSSVSLIGITAFDLKGIN
ncbi:MAG: Rpp14/Pop5 family protein [Methanocellales archaeon]